MSFLWDEVECLVDVNYSHNERNLGIWVSVSVVLLSVIYAVTLTGGLLSLKSQKDPISEPFFSILELLIIILSPAMVIVMAVVHAWTPPGKKTFSLIALIFMSLLAGLTCTLHFVILSVSHQIASESLPWLPVIFSFKWPSVAYAIDILAWDIFFPLSMLFAAPLFKGSRLKTSIRVLMTTSGILAFAGLIGLPFGDMQLRMIGVVGYAVVYPFAIAFLAILFYKSPAFQQSAKL